jgi:hypothetical protein
MTRLERKNRTDILYSGGDITNAFDNVIKENWRINDDEYDYIAENASDEVINHLIAEDMTFSEKRKALTLINKLLEEYDKSRSN